MVDIQIPTPQPQYFNSQLVLKFESLCNEQYISKQGAKLSMWRTGTFGNCIIPVEQVCQSLNKGANSRTAL